MNEMTPIGTGMTARARSVPILHYTLERLAFGGQTDGALDSIDQKILDEVVVFYRSNDHPFVDQRTEADLRKAIENGWVYVIKDENEQICASAIAWRYPDAEGKKIIEIGSIRSTGPYGYNLSRSLVSCMITDCCKEKDVQRGTVPIISGIYPANDQSRRILTGNVLQYKPDTPTEAFKRARDGTLQTPAPEAQAKPPLEYFRFDPVNITDVFVHIADLRAHPVRYNKHGASIYFDVKPWDMQTAEPGWGNGRDEAPRGFGS